MARCSVLLVTLMMLVAHHAHGNTRVLRKRQLYNLEEHLDNDLANVWTATSRELGTDYSPSPPKGGEGKGGEGKGGKSSKSEGKGDYGGKGSKSTKSEGKGDYGGKGSKSAKSEGKGDYGGKGSKSVKSEGKGDYGGKGSKSVKSEGKGGYGGYGSKSAKAGSAKGTKRSRSQPSGGAEKSVKRYPIPDVLGPIEDKSMEYIEAAFMSMSMSLSMSMSMDYRFLF